ncbi:hypothetical protein ACHWQZ_G006724 [Mnemiopsis leidyi]
MDCSSMTEAGQSLTDPSRLMRKGGTRYPTRFISQQIIHVDPVFNKSNPVNHTKRVLRFGTWNVLSLVSSSTQLHQLSQNIDQYRLDLLGITETHMPGSGTTLLDNGSLLIHSGRLDGIKRQGVGLSLSKRIRNSLISFTPTSERVLTARLHSKHLNISVVVAYAPTDGADESEKDKFYRTLTDTFDELPRHDLKLLLGDFNVKVSSDRYGSEAVIGGESLHSSSNDNGTRLVDFCATNQLVIGGTIFQHKDIHKGTWRSPNGLTVNQIDHICIGKRFRQSLLDVKVCRGADIGSDHYLVLGLLKIRLQSVAKVNAKRNDVPAIERLRDGTKVIEYNIALHNRFASLDSEVDLEGMWKAFSQTVSDVSLEVLGKRPRKAKEQHLSQKTKNLLIQRGEFKRRDPNSDANRSEYSRLNKLVKKSSKLDDNNWAVRVATDLEEAASKGQQREVWAKIRKISGKNKKAQASSVRDKDGRMITDPQQQRDRWKEHFTELLNPPLSSVNLSDLDNIPPQPSFDTLSCSDGPPTRDEISYSLKKLKNHKSPGVDGITNEQLKYGESALVTQLECIFKKVWEEEAVPEDWLKGVIIVIGKKGDTSLCSNNRGITLRTTASKLFQMILLKRLQAGLECLLRENQCGFRRNRSCIDQIYSLRTIIHNCLEFNIPLFINFVDFKAAFDCIRRDFIWRSMRHYGLPEKYVRIFQSFFRGTRSAVRINGELTDWFDVNSGTGQGDIQGPPVFNFCLNFATFLAETNKTISKGAVLQKGNMKVEEKVILDTDYADDMAILDNSGEGLQESTDLLAHYSSYAGLKINAKKTQCMAVSKCASQRPFIRGDCIELSVGGEPVEQVSNFVYLGATISGDGTIDRDLDVRIQKANGAFHQLWKIWNSRTIRTPTKIRIYKAAVLTILLYGAEVWNTTKKQMKRFEVFHQTSLRRILRIKWFYHVSNEEVLRRAGIKPVETFISAARLRWYGHVVRMPDYRIPKFLLNWKPNYGKRSRGRPRKDWKSCVLEDAATFTGVKDINNSKTEALAANRVQWRNMLRHQRDVCDAGHSND